MGFDNYSKIGAPHHKEIAIGAVTVDGQYLLYEEYIEHLHVPTGYIEQEIEKNYVKSSDD